LIERLLIFQDDGLNGGSGTPENSKSFYLRKGFIPLQAHARRWRQARQESRYPTISRKPERAVNLRSNLVRRQKETKTEVYFAEWPWRSLMRYSMALQAS